VLRSIRSCLCPTRVTCSPTAALSGAQRTRRVNGGGVPTSVLPPRWLNCSSALHRFDHLGVGLRRVDHHADQTRPVGRELG